MRVKRGNVLQKHHKKIIKYAKGFRGSKSTLFIAANQALMQAWKNAYRDRRKRKRDFRSLWIVRINAACRMQGLNLWPVHQWIAKGQCQFKQKGSS